MERQPSFWHLSPYLNNLARTTDATALLACLDDCVAPRDATRRLAFAQLVSVLANAGASVPTDPKRVLRLGNLAYDQLFDFGVWHSALSHVSYPARFVRLSPTQLGALQAGATTLMQFYWQTKQGQLVRCL